MHGVFAAGVIALVAAGHAGAFGIRGQVIATGGTPSTGVTGPGRILYGTVGQAAVGRGASGEHLACHGFWCFGGSRVVAVDPPPAGPGLPIELAFSQPRPNPARDHVSFELALPKEAQVNLDIFDVQGRRVYTMLDRRVEAGYHDVRWDGEENAAAGGSGIYFARLRVDGRPVANRRIVMMR
jgi:hypothetical protein